MKPWGASPCLKILQWKAWRDAKAADRAPWWDAKTDRDGARLQIIMGRVARVLGYEFDEDWATRCPPGLKHISWTFDVDLYMSYSNDLCRLEEIDNLSCWVKRAVQRSPRKLRMFLQQSPARGDVDEEWVRKFRRNRAMKRRTTTKATEFSSPILPIVSP